MCVLRVHLPPSRAPRRRRRLRQPAAAYGGWAISANRLDRNVERQTRRAAVDRAAKRRPRSVCGANRGAAVDVGMQSYPTWRRTAAVRAATPLSEEKSDRMPRNKTGRRAFADDQLPEPARKSASFPDTNVVFKKQSLSTILAPSYYRSLLLPSLSCWDFALLTGLRRRGVRRRRAGPTAW